MQIYDLSFNALVFNVKEDCTTFFCPIDSKLIRSIQEYFDIRITGIDLTVGSDVNGDSDAVCLGKVYNKCQIMRLPTVYAEDTDMYLDITLLVTNQNVVQVTIFKYAEFPTVKEVYKDYDAYKLFYEYVGSIQDLKARIKYESSFIHNMHNNANGSITDDVFTENVDKYIIGELFK